MAEGLDFKKIGKQLESLAAILPSEKPDVANTPPRALKSLRALVVEVSQRLALFGRWIDPVEHPDELFDPSNPNHAAELIAARLERREKRPLNSLQAFYGSGVYALYYRGGHPAYQEIAGSEIPIYVGKAEPASPRAETPEEQGPKLYARFQDHAKSIRAAQRFAINEGKPHPVLLEEFDCRYLALASAYAGAVEASVIRRYQPVWNTVCPGFGKHGDSPTTRANTRSEWDTLHPGRAWALSEGNIANPKSAERIQAMIIEHSKSIRETLEKA